MSGSTRSARGPVSRRFERGTLVAAAAFAALAVGAVLVGDRYRVREARAIFREAETELEVVAHSKVAQLQQWRRERLGDGAVLAERSARWSPLASVDDGERRREPGPSYAHWLQSYLDAYGAYDRAYVVAADGAVRLAVPEGVEPPTPTIARGVQHVLRSAEVELLDFYQDPGDGHAHLALLVPVRDGSAGPVVGVVVLRISPKAHVHPTLDRWPGARATAEAQLLRREGDAAVLLYTRGSEDPRRVPLTRLDRLAVRAALGERGIIRGVDHHEVPVLGHVAPIPGTPWILVTSVHVSEIEAIVAEHVRAGVVIVALFLLGAGLAFVLVLRELRLRSYRRQAELSDRLADSEARLRLAMRAARQGLFEVDLRSGAITTSPEYAAMLGHEPVELVETAARWSTHIHPDDVALGVERMQAYVAGARDTYETELRQRKKTGEWIWTHAIGRIVERDATGEPTRLVGVYTDVTARKEAELRAENLARLYATLSRCNEAIVRCASEEELLPHVCQTTVEEGSFSTVWIGRYDPSTREVRSVAAYGVGSEALRTFVMSVEPGAPFADTPTARAVRDARPEWVEDLRTWPDAEPWRAAALSRGWAGAAALPLVRGEAVVGVMTILSPSAEAFDEQRRRLLTEMAADLGFALEGFAREAHRRQMEESLRHSERRYRALFEDSGAPSLLIDVESGAIVDANHAAERFYGWDLATLRGMSIEEINVLPLPQLKGELALASARKKNRFRFRHRTASGDVREVESYTASLVVDGRARVQSMIIDVTARVHAEAALRHNEHLLSESQRLARVGSWTIGEDGALAWSEEMFRIFGLALDAPVPSPDEFLAMVHPDDRAVVEAVLAKSLRGEPMRDVEYRIVLADGQVRHLNARGDRRTDPVRGTYVAGSVQDVTERHAAEEALHVKDWAIESSVNPIAIAALDGRVTYANRAFVDVFATDAADVRGRLIHEVVAGLPSSPEALRALLADRSWAGEVRVVRGDRTYDLLVSATLVSNRQGRPVCVSCAFSDISERRRAEDAIRASLAEKDALLKEVHHRVKNNLQIVSSLLRLEVGRRDDPGVRAVLGEMQNRIMSMALLHQTLYRSDDLAEVDLSIYLNNLATHLFRAMAPSNARIALRVDVDPACVELDQAVPCGLLVTELLSNCLKHGFPDDRRGHVTLTLRAPMASVITLTISDTGVGLPADLDAKRTRSLGLQLVSDLARQLRGQLTSASDGGASFSITFPVHRAIARRLSAGGARPEAR
ncbi:PAS domain S-box protein [Myxococcota bacterium]|nr:PAS domain S-box protein [Myxococcota bacterium]